MAVTQDRMAALVHLRWLPAQAAVEPVLGKVLDHRELADGTAVARVEGTPSDEKETPPVYDVLLDIAAPLSSSCDCGDFEHRRKGIAVCKHIVAVACLLDGALPAALPLVAEPLPPRDKEENRTVGDHRPAASTAPVTPANAPASRADTTPTVAPVNPDGRPDRRFRGQRPTPDVGTPPARDSPRRAGGRPATLSLVRSRHRRDPVPPPLPATLPVLDPVHDLGRPDRKKEQVRQHYELLTIGAFTSRPGVPEGGAAMDIREAVVRYRLLGRVDHAQVALMWCAWREPGDAERELLLTVAATVSRRCVTALREWLRELR
ncbi:SWIM zinc finger family protein [Corynebacterium nuruki]|uniref:SWIM zinc finger family protein n=1 Tax=Corynebacterium nuruki TaxID=1032851 RepID=UPI0002486198|nr:SWIM zinc finger family protein [Corynebacterium nuruki]